MRCSGIGGLLLFEWFFLLQGLLDEQFQQLQSLQDETNPCFVMEVVTLFCDDAERIFGELDKIMYVLIFNLLHLLSMCVYDEIGKFFYFYFLVFAFSGISR